MPAHQGRTALYRLYDATGTVIYVGIASNPHTRWEQHAGDKSWWPDVVTREIEWCETRQAAADMEAAEVIARSPKWNDLIPRRRDDWPLQRSQAMRAGWEPGQDLLDLFDQYDAELLVAAGTRDRISAELVDVLRSGVSRNRVAKMVPWSQPVIFGLAKQAGIKGVRQQRADEAGAE